MSSTQFAFSSCLFCYLVFDLSFLTNHLASHRPTSTQLLLHPPHLPTQCVSEAGLVFRPGAVCGWFLRTSIQGFVQIHP